jgi:hypothetical protein
MVITARLLQSILQFSTTRTFPRRDNDLYVCSSTQHRTASPPASPVHPPHIYHLNCPPNLPNTPKTVANRLTCKNALTPMFPHIMSLYSLKFQNTSGPMTL